MYEGYICTCTEVQCHYCTRRARKMHDHMPVHGRKASEHTNAMPLWRACKLQTYFTAKGLIDYFVFEEDPFLPTTGGALAGSGLAMASTLQEEGKLFEDLKADIIQASRDLDEEAEIVQDGPTAEANRVGIQAVIDRALGWERRSGATFEEDKTVIIHFTRHHERTDESPYTIKGQAIIPKKSGKILLFILRSSAG
ncbi:hypothetical protein LZL87_014103 [Fusarium oxysporum]|nr:hypothetical protein LZL87_014103 [Fusarium oxysporum]